MHSVSHSLCKRKLRDSRGPGYRTVTPRKKKKKEQIKEKKRAGEDCYRNRFLVAGGDNRVGERFRGGNDRLRFLRLTQRSGRVLCAKRDKGAFSSAAGPLIDCRCSPAMCCTSAGRVISAKCGFTFVGGAGDAARRRGRSSRFCRF